MEERKTRPISRRRGRKRLAQYDIVAPGYEQNPSDTLNGLLENIKNDLEKLSNRSKYYWRTTEVTLPKWITKEVEKLAQMLTKQYGVTVTLLDTDAQYDSAETLERTAREGVFFISKESPVETARSTIHLLNFIQVQKAVNPTEPKVMLTDQAGLLELAHQKRQEQVQEKAQEFAAEITKIKDQYRASHGGKDPNLSRIAELLNAENVPSPSGKSKWVAQTVKRVLSRTDTQREK